MEEGIEDATSERYETLGEYYRGIDENNLAEFPLTLLSDTAAPGQKTIEFQDTLRDWKTGQTITRRVCVTGSDKFGLPTAKDEQVLMALVQLTRIANNFANPEVPFSKHQVIELLGWENRGWAYDRVEESLHRWKGVSVHYWNAWRDHASGTWTDTEAIGVIDYFRLTDGRRTRSEDRLDARSKFVWNRELFKSFQAGYLKPLDFGLYRSLKRPAARRAFRLLDKRFHHRPHWEFDLHNFACEKLGFSRNYDTGQLKARLAPAMSELEEVGFISPVSYKKVRRKEWKIAVSKKSAPEQLTKPTSEPPETNCAEWLRSRGVARETAIALANEFASTRIQEKVEYFDWLTARGDKRISGNPPGFLVAAIKNDYPLPKDYLKAKSAKQNEAVRLKSAKRSPTTSKSACRRAPQSEPLKISVILERFSREEREVLEKEAVAAARSVERQSYERQRLVGGSLFEALRGELIGRFLRATGRLTD